jgi:hypothetical protein
VTFIIIARYEGQLLICWGLSGSRDQSSYVRIRLYLDMLTCKEPCVIRMHLVDGRELTMIKVSSVFQRGTWSNSAEQHYYCRKINRVRPYRRRHLLSTCFHCYPSSLSHYIYSLAQLHVTSLPIKTGAKMKNMYELRGVLINVGCMHATKMSEFNLS